MYYHMCYIDSQFCQFHRMLSLLHITLNTSQRRRNKNYKVFDTSTEWCRNNEWCQITKVDAPETNQPTQTPSTSFHCLEFATNQPSAKIKTAGFSADLFDRAHLCDVREVAFKLRLLIIFPNGATNFRCCKKRTWPYLDSKTCSGER